MRFLKSEAGALVLWLMASLLLAALLTPHLYDAGKAFAESAQTKNYSGALESVAQSAQKAKPDRYFSRCLLVSSLVLLPFLIRRVKRIPDQGNRAEFALIKQSWKQRGIQLALGLVIGMVALGALALVLHFTEASEPNGKTVSFSKILSKGLVPALGAGIIEEWIFRGLLLGLWLRACSPKTAWIGSSVMFSFLHFLKPPKGIEISDPYAWHSGLEILSSTFGHFTNPTFFVTEFATLTFLGIILAYSRIRSRSLCFAIGLHTGLVFALKTFSMTQVLIPSSPLHPWLIGVDLKSGLLPLMALGFCMIACVYALRKSPINNPS
ncbi:MAG: CPBP family intramembrane glutamic endopeptidase [Akkermansiaceae bacterium]|jgi:membrane protease YdiL (CAAX protease family)|nr:CPBP family intramembrane metalloprotease [Luteolibacter sp.]